MVEDLALAVSEIRRTLRPGGRFLFYEHVASKGRTLRALQTVVNPLWRLATTGCNLHRDTAETIREEGFEVVDFERVSMSVGLPVTIPVIVGSARV